MERTRVFPASVAVIVVAVLALVSTAAQAKDEDRRFKFQYAAKIVCGCDPQPAIPRIIPGQYATSVNIHNPSGREATLRKKLALTFPAPEIPHGRQVPGRVSDFLNDRLGPDEALQVDCAEMPSDFFPGGGFGGSVDPPYIEGFLVIESTRSLDVIAVYSTGVFDEPSCPGVGDLNVKSMDVEDVRERKIKRRGNDD